MRKLLTAAIAAATLITLTGCNKPKLTEPEPGYARIEYGTKDLAQSYRIAKEHCAKSGANAIFERQMPSGVVYYRCRKPKMM